MCLCSASSVTLRSCHGETNGNQVPGSPSRYESVYRLIGSHQLAQPPGLGRPSKNSGPLKTTCRTRTVSTDGPYDQGSSETAQLYAAARAVLGVSGVHPSSEFRVVASRSCAGLARQTQTPGGRAPLSTASRICPTTATKTAHRWPTRLPTNGQEPSRQAGTELREWPGLAAHTVRATQPAIGTSRRAAGAANCSPSSGTTPLPALA